MTGTKLSLCFILLIFLRTSCGATGHRKALLIGNTRYTAFTSLGGLPLADVDAMYESLQKVGFEREDITELTDLTRLQMQTEIEAFSSHLHTEDSALFYFSGHGFSIDGEDYLAPVDFSFGKRTQEATRQGAQSLRKVLAKFGVAHTRVIILDACRDEPENILALPKDLVAGEDLRLFVAPPVAFGTLIAFATGLGQIATARAVDGTSFYTHYLLESLNSGPPDLQQALSMTQSAVYAASNKTQSPAIYQELPEPFLLNRVANYSSVPVNLVRYNPSKEVSVLLGGEKELSLAVGELDQSAESTLVRFTDGKGNNLDEASELSIRRIADSHYDQRLRDALKMVEGKMESPGFALQTALTVSGPSRDVCTTMAPPPGTPLRLAAIRLKKAYEKCFAVNSQQSPTSIAFSGFDFPGTQFQATSAAGIAFDRIIWGLERSEKTKHARVMVRRSSFEDFARTLINKTEIRNSLQTQLIQAQSKLAQLDEVLQSTVHIQVFLLGNPGGEDRKESVERYNRVVMQAEQKRNEDYEKLRPSLQNVRVLTRAFLLMTEKEALDDDDAFRKISEQKPLPARPPASEAEPLRPPPPRFGDLGTYFQNLERRVKMVILDITDKETRKLGTQQFDE